MTAPTPPRTQWLRLALPVAVALVVALVFELTGLHQRLEAASFDLRVRQLTERAAPSDVALVLVDDATLALLAPEGVRWPFPRDLWIGVLDVLRREGARAVAFDLLWSEPDASFDDVLAGALPLGPPAVVALQCKGTGLGALPLAWALTATAADATGSLAPCTPTPPVAPIAAAAARGGFVDFDADPDGVMRHTRLLRRDADGRLWPSLPLAAWMAAHPGAEVSLREGAVRVGDHDVALDAEGRVLVRWRPGSARIASYGVGALLAADEAARTGAPAPVDLSGLRGKTVFVGTSAAGTFDLRATPLAEADAGVRVHVDAYATLDGGERWRRPAAAHAWLAALALALLVAFATARLRSWPLQFGGGLSAWLAWIVAASAALPALGLWLDLATPTVAFIAAQLAATGMAWSSEGRQRRELRRAFSLYLSPLVIDELLADPNRLQLGGERREITAFFSDIAGFTTLSESMDAQALVAFLNDYLTELTDIILDCGGTVDKYEGDAIIAMFGAPVEHPDHAERAVRAALACQARLEALRSRWEAAGIGAIRTRIGLNSGVVVVGNMGSKKRFDYTMIGDAVNLAARLEGANKVFGSEILIGERTAELVGDAFVLRELDRVRVKGKTRGVAVYEPLAAAGSAAAAAAARAERYAHALEAYRGGDFALAAARSAAAGDDAALASLCERATAFAASPPPDWDGTLQLTSK